jgi:threonine/homoserine/homoserine lactone efflux protein
VGCTAGIIPHLLATILGLAALLHTSSVAFQFIKYIGAAYLFYLAWSIWRQTGGLKIQNEIQQKTLADIALKGFLINILNPKLSIFFLAFLPQFIPINSEIPIQSMLILSMVFMAMTFLVFVIYGLFANSMRLYIIHSPKLMRLTQRTFAAVFAALGGKLIFTNQ